jgi:hypothetical protein
VRCRLDRDGIDLIEGSSRLRSGLPYFMQRVMLVKAPNQSVLCAGF